jgi:hypothetical protein
MDIDDPPLDYIGPKLNPAYNQTSPIFLATPQRPSGSFKPLSNLPARLWTVHDNFEGKGDDFEFHTPSKSPDYLALHTKGFCKEGYELRSTSFGFSLALQLVSCHSE